MTNLQHDTLAALEKYPRTTTYLAVVLHISTGAARHRLRRLEDNGLVRRTYPIPGEAVWELTADGRAAIK